MELTTKPDLDECPDRVEAWWDGHLTDRPPVTLHVDSGRPLRQITPQVLVMYLRLVHEFLQPARNEFGALIVTSGYRNQTLNMLVGGASSSRHMGMTQDGLFAAADFFFSNVKAADAFEHMEETRAMWDRLTLYPNESRLHVDISANDQRGLLYIDEGDGWVQC